MKPKKGILTLAAITALFSAGGCDLNNNVCVYGPPPDDYNIGVPPSYSETERPEVFDPSENIPDEVYGPPSFFDGTDEEETTVETVESAETFDPAENIAETVYGPPTMEASEESTATEDTSDIAEQEE